VATDDYCLIKSKITFICRFFFKTVPRNGAIHYYFDSAIRNSILSVHYQIKEGGFAETWGSALIFSAN